jgi:hypothetical protein
MCISVQERARSSAQKFNLCTGMQECAPPCTKVRRRFARFSRGVELPELLRARDHFLFHATELEALLFHVKAVGSDDLLDFLFGRHYASSS